MFRTLLVALFFSTVGIAAQAQTAVGGPVSPFKDTSMLKPPAGVRVAVIEWEDLECPACAHAFPIVHAAIAHYKIPLVRYDFQIPGHIWSHEAALYARYLQDKVNFDLSIEYRREVFASQFRIATKDDLKQFTQQFFSSHGQMLPFVLDPSGQLEREVSADTALGDKLGLRETPTIIVVTPRHWIQVKSTDDLYSAIDQALAEAGPAAPVHHAAATHAAVKKQ